MSNGDLPDTRSFSPEAATSGVEPPAPKPDAPTSATIHAGGDTAVGVGSNFAVSADRKVIGSAEVTAKAGFDGSFDASVFDLGAAAAPEEVAIRFTDDRHVQSGGPNNDRNLFIDRIEIGDAA